MSKYKIIIILSCIIIVIAFVSGKFFTTEMLSNKTMKSVLVKPNNLDNKNIQVINKDNSNTDSKTSTNMDKQQNSIENTNSNNSNSSNTANNSDNNELIVSEKMVTQNGEVVIPAKVVYKGDDYNPQNIKNMQLPNGYQFARLNVYNNGNIVETGGTQTTNLQNFKMQLPTMNNLTSGNLMIEYIVQKLQI